MQGIPEGINSNRQLKDKVITFVKKELQDLRKIDNVINVLLKTDDFDFQKGVGFYPVQFLEESGEFSIKYFDATFKISKEMIERLVQGYRTLYVVECTIFVPIFSAPKWVKGLIKEKDFELQIFAPGFTIDDAKFHLEVIKFDSDERELLQTMAGGRLLVLYIQASQLS